MKIEISDIPKNVQKIIINVFNDDFSVKTFENVKNVETVKSVEKENENTQSEKISDSEIPEIPDEMNQEF